MNENEMIAETLATTNDEIPMPLFEPGPEEDQYKCRHCGSEDVTDTSNIGDFFSLTCEGCGHYEVRTSKGGQIKDRTGKVLRSYSFLSMPDPPGTG